MKAELGAKSRLANTLSAAQRGELQQVLLQDLLEGLKSSVQLAGIALYGPVRASPLAAGNHAYVSLNEPPTVTNLNAAISDGTIRLAKMGAQIIAVLPGDLPLVEGAELDRAISYVSHTGNCAVVPDHWKQGTNALVFPAERPPVFKMGQGSFHKHMLAENRCRSLELRSFALDIDTADDLERLRNKGDTPRGQLTKLFLETALPSGSPRLAKQETGT